MNKRDKKIAVIKKSLKNCYNEASVYVYGNIPKEKYRNVCSTYAGNVDYGNVFGLIDETLFGNAKKGMLFTEDGYYASLTNKFYPYKDCVTFKEFPLGYNKVAFDELINALYNIEIEPTGWDIAGGLLGAFFEGVKEAVEEIEEKNSENEVRGLLGEALSAVNTVIQKITVLQNGGKEYTDGDEFSEYLNNVDEFANTFNSSEFMDMAEIIDNSYEPELDDDLEDIKYKSGAKKFVRKIKSAVEDYEDETNTSSETIEMIQQTLREFKKINKQAKNNISIILEHD